MRALAAIVHYAAAAVMIAAMLIVVAITLPIVAICRALRWAELRYVYAGDVQARDKDRWHAS